MCEGVADQTELQNIDSHSYGHNSVSFPFSWAAQLGAWGPSLSETCSHSSIFSPTDLNSNCSIGGQESPLCWALVFSTTSYLQLIEIPVHRVILFFTNRTHATRPRSRLYLDIPRPNAPVIYTGAFPILTAWPGSICYICTLLNDFERCYVTVTI